MKKEGLIAIFLGIIIGVVFAFFLVNQIKKSHLDQNKTLIKNQPTITPLVKNLETSFLEITTPEDHRVFTQPSINIKGKANKNYLIIISSPIKEVVINNKNGDFQTDFPLALGENNIQIVLYSKEKSKSILSKTLTVYYLPNN